MSDQSRRLYDYLDHILKAIGKIERFTAGMDESAFMQDELIQDEVIRNFEIIGEASRKILQRFPDAITGDTHRSLTAAYEMRNILAHGYTEVDLHIIWTTISKDLPMLRQRVHDLLA